MSLDYCLALGDTLGMTTETQHRPHLDQSDGGAEKLNKILLCAAAFAALTTVAHIFGGGASVAKPIAESSLADEPRLLALAVWHMVSITFVLSVLGFGLGALPRHQERSRYLVAFISVLWIGFGLAVVGVILTEPGDDLFRKFPQPVLLIPVGLLGLWGIRRGAGSAM